MTGKEKNLGRISEPANNGERYSEVERNRRFRVGLMRRGDGDEIIEVIVHLIPQGLIEVEDIRGQFCLLESLWRRGFSLWGDGGDVVAERPLGEHRADIGPILDELLGRSCTED